MLVLRPMSGAVIFADSHRADNVQVCSADMDPIGVEDVDLRLDRDPGELV